MAFETVTLLTMSMLLIVEVGASVAKSARVGHGCREALEDDLTGIGNRNALFRFGPVLVEATLRTGKPAALLLMDLDGFAAVNHLHGHHTGDRLLLAFCRMAHDYLPPTSLVCRVSGEEIAAVLPAADPLRARAVADEIRELFSHLALAGPPGPGRTTVSIGVAQATSTDITDLLDRADHCLQVAKAGGRNRAVHEGNLGEATR